MYIPVVFGIAAILPDANTANKQTNDADMMTTRMKKKMTMKRIVVMLVMVMVMKTAVMMMVLNACVYL